MGIFNNLINKISGNNMSDDGASALRNMFGMSGGNSGSSGSGPKYTYDQSTQTYTAMAKGGKVSSASKRADGIAQRGKTRGTMVMCGGGYAKGKK